jgi:type IV pilus assembly protein PilX
MSALSRPVPRNQRGVILITAMLLLIVVTIMAVSMFRSYGVEERIAGNTRDKQRAINAAVSAQQYAEYLLASGTAPISGLCPAGILPTGSEVCTNSPMPNFTTLPWNAGVTYSNFTSNSINGINNIVPPAGTAPTPDLPNQSASYFAAPIFYITDLGPNLGSPAGEVYQIDALGYGGTSNTVAVVESTFVIGTNTATSLTGP